MALKQLTYKNEDNCLVISWVTQLKFSCSSNSVQGLFIAQSIVESQSSLERSSSLSSVTPWLGKE